MERADAAVDPVASRLDRLERRVTALERRDHPDRPAASDSARVGDVADADRFWALVGLQSRLEGRSAVLFTGSVTLPGGAHYEWQQGADTDHLLSGAWDTVGDVLGALGHPARLAILREVLRGATGVGEIGAIERLGTSGQLYHHLRELVAAGWLRSMGRGRYEVPGPRIVPLLVILAAAQR